MKHLRTKIAAIVLTAAMAIAIVPATAFAAAPAPDPDTATGDSLVDPNTRQVLLDYYDSASAFLVIHQGELADDVRIYLETMRAHAYDVLMHGGYEGHNESIAEMRVALSVAQAYANGRQPDPNAEPEFVIGSEAYNRTHPLLVSQDMANSIAWTYATSRDLPAEMIQQRILGLFVDRIYTAALGRPSDEAGRTYWVNSIISGERTANDVIITILQSQEFVGINLSDQAYVTALYKVFFDRSPDTQGLNNWVGVLQSGTSREDLVRTFTTTQEWHNICSYYGL